jgi:hypothetical protein
MDTIQRLNGWRLDRSDVKVFPRLCWNGVFAGVGVLVSSTHAEGVTIDILYTLAQDIV